MNIRRDYPDSQSSAANSRILRKFGVDRPWNLCETWGAREEMRLSGYR